MALRHHQDLEPRPNWHAEQIKAAIRMRGVTLGQLSVGNGLHESACRAALIRSCPAAERAISAFLGVPLHELWPERWDESGLRIRHVRDQDNHVRVEKHPFVEISPLERVGPAIQSGARRR